VCGKAELKGVMPGRFSAGSPEAQLEEYQDGDVLSSTIMYGLGNRSNGGKSQNPHASQTEACGTLSYFRALTICVNMICATRPSLIRSVGLPSQIRW
jgi:hypothetical protein